MTKMTPIVDYLAINLETTHHKNLKTIISSLYGWKTWNKFHLMENLRIKIIRRAADLDFLKQCRDNKLNPKFAYINHPLRNRWNNRAFE
jgi:hypothetical protein